MAKQMKKQMRKLTENEKKLCRRSIVGMEERVRHLNFLSEYNKLMINKGLELNYLEKLREFKSELKTIEGEIQEKEIIVKTLNNQIRNGVEVIKKKEATKAPGVG